MTRTRTRTTAGAAGGVLAVLLLSGCGGGSGDSASGSAADVGSSGSRAAVGSAQPGAPQVGTEKAADGSARSEAAAPLVTDQRVVRDASMTVRAKDVAGAAARVRTAAEVAKGFVADEKTTSGDRAGSTESVLTLRVPNAGLDRVMTQVAATGTLVDRTQSSEDVTQTYVDVRSRVASQTASVERVRALLSRATTIGQIVQVEGELSRREADLESMKAQLASLEDRTQLSTLTVTLTPPLAAASPVTSEPAGFLGGLRGGWDALLASLAVLLTVVGALLPFAVLAALVGVPVWLVWRRTRRTTGAPAAPPAQAQPAP